MRTAIKSLALAAALLTGVAASGAAFAWHGHSHFGVYVGVPLYSPWYYPPAYYPPAYYYPPYVPPVVVTQPPVYVEQAPAESAAPAPQPQQYWYYCSASKTYYPYVKECPGGWQRVAPQPG